MAYINGKISGSVSTKDIQQALGTNERRQSYLCTHSSINKLSKIKPIPYPTQGERCPNFKGTADDNNRGIYYGLKMGCVSFGSDIHNSKWDYIRPSGGIGIAPFRRLDFSGYNHNAIPTLSGYSSECQNGKVYYDSGSPMTAVLEWNRADNTDGVDTLGCIDGVDMTTWYLCVAIDGWIRAMINNDAANAVLPIVYNGMECTRYTCPALPEELKQSGEHTVTFFLADLSNKIEFKSQWVDASNDIAPTYNLITIYDAVGYNVVFSPNIPEYMSATVGISASSSAISAGVLVSKYTDIEQQYVITLEFGGASAAKKTFIGGTAMSVLPRITWTESELGLKVEFGSGTSYEYTVSLYGSNTDEELLKLIDTKTGTITI